MINGFWNYINLGKNYYRKCFDAVCKKYGLSGLEVDVIMFLNNCQGYNTASDIVLMRGVAKSNLSSAIASLTEKGYIEGYYENNDRRSVHLRLLDSTAEIIAEGLEAQKKFVSALIDGFSQEELKTMDVNFKRILNNIKKANK